MSSYPVTVNRHTAGGVAIDDPRQEIDDAAVDAAFNAVEACLASHPRTLTAADTSQFAMWCSTHTVPATIDRAAMTVKVAPDWHVSQCSSEQVFSCDIRAADCEAKGQQPTEACPCQCRHSVQPGPVLVVTPNLLLLRAAIVEAVTGCQNPWGGSLRSCTH
jgi:hypothetical protein